MINKSPFRIRTINAFHQFRNLPPPEHPLFSIIDLSKIKQLNHKEPLNLQLDFYGIGFKKDFNAKVKYGQKEFDFDEGVLGFTSPGQVFSIELDKGAELRQTGRLLLIHPDFLWHTPLAGKIRQYDFFGYAINEALFLSAKEKAIIAGIIQNLESEYQSNIDKLSQDIIISQIETLLAYSERFYQRQFVTRKKVNHELLSHLEELLSTYFEGESIHEKGLPTVAYVAEQLHVSPNYLGAMLRVLTAMNTQQHIHAKLIEKAKEKLSTTNLSVSEIAFSLGFEHIQSFSKLFKTKTQMSPVEFKRSFN